MWSIIEWKLVRIEVVFTLLWQSVLNNLPANNFSNEQSWVIIFSICTSGLCARVRRRCCPPPTLTWPPSPAPASRPPTASAWCFKRLRQDTLRSGNLNRLLKNLRNLGYLLISTSTWTTQTQIVNEESMGQWACQFKVLNYSAIFITFTPRSTEIRQLS